MRVGYNPHKDQPQEASAYLHQVVIPVFIPHQQGYFKDSFKIFKLCLESLFATCHERTFITIVNNGSESAIVDYLDGLLKAGKIHELIHTQNIGKLNAILKGVVGNDIELVTISDSDVLFLSDWQVETNRVFAAFPKVGVVGIVPQYRTFLSFSYNLLFDQFRSSKLKFIPVKNPQALKMFYKSLGWDDNANPDYLKFSLGYEADNGLLAYVGSGHFVATYKKQIFDQVTSYIGFKMGGDSETYLDEIPLKKDYWRLTTYDNHAYHMGNVYEDWMGEITFNTKRDYEFQSNFKTYGNSSKWHYHLRHSIFRKFIKSRKFRRLFYRFKGLPAAMIEKY
ncbi:glycosyltransferase family 2 protein [Flavobacterium sp. CYK-4]|uniref:glycosyltransferase family A protein n=1 Tax=Flavobacterium lotistagni TaxID=2709660 RepID=UPI0014072841|nr:glycosyltransferase family A protein [Flavobacterium lotistagni]NHM06414.1 glycosyltransferase family 2 protein [Flavobacterium lotistagni]